MFLSFHGNNEFRLENVYYQDTVNGKLIDLQQQRPANRLFEALREEVLPMWPHGVESEVNRGNTWWVRFSGQPWKSGGSEGLEYVHTFDNMKT
jgi:hypothetical protein